MISNEEILKRLEKQDLRLSKLERHVEANYYSEEPEIDPEKIEEEVKESYNFPKLTFNQVITFIGVLGIIIGAISFLFYAVANNWIGETGQIIIGVTLGFILFGLASTLRKSKEQWSNIIFGGAYIIEFLTIGVGVLEYQVIPELIGILLAVAFLVSSVILSITFKSKVIAYFALVGGYLIPFITGTLKDDLFVMSFYILLSIGLVVLSFAENWYDLRLSSYVVISLFILYSFERLTSADNKAIPMIFMTLIFILYKTSVLLFSTRNQKKEFSTFESLTVASLSILFLSFVYQLFDLPLSIYGIFVMLFSFVYMAEILYFKSQKSEVSKSVLHTLLSIGIITINLGFLMLINSVDKDFFLILFAIEYVLFSIISSKAEDANFYKSYSYILLGLITFWYAFILRFETSFEHATFFIFFLLAIVISFLVLFKKNINFKVNAASFLIGGFAFIYSLYKYSWYLGLKNEAAQIVLSILWLIYTLTMFSHVETRGGKQLAGLLLGATLIKIAFNDLLYLSGAFRIIGFILFGTLLIIGGYLIKGNEEHEEIK
ncbi:MAG: DUF2339 domain-containing protein [Nanoarchaeota archaeon]|nr:DUF2339 domain-containing protein [Nanoarchaeota archaeon]